MRTLTLALAAAVLLVAPGAQALEKRRLCIYDPAGANGDFFNMGKDYRAAATAWGVQLELKAYTNEQAVQEDYKAGQCDLAMLTSTRTRPFNRFTGSFESVGGITDYKQVQMLISSLSAPQAAPLMVDGDHEVVAVMPGGAVWLYLRDRTINTAEKLSGKKIATMDFDEAAKFMVRHVGASPVGADVTTFSGMFNNGAVDICYAPGFAFRALELYKGVGKKGGVVRYPLAQLTVQAIAHRSRFPEGFGQKSRQWVTDNFQSLLAIVQQGDRDIPEELWVDIPAADKARYDAMFQSVRLVLRDKEKVYDQRALALLRRIRCKSDPKRAECAESKE